MTARQPDAEPTPAGPARRPILGARHAAAHLMMGLYAADRLGDVRRAAWYSGVCAGFALIIPRGGAFAPPGSANRVLIDEAGRILLTLKARRPDVHWRTLDAIYLLGQYRGGRAWRAALDAFARVERGQGDDFHPPRSHLLTPGRRWCKD